MHQTVAEAVKSTLGYGLEATHDALEVGADVFRFVPIPGLEEAARVLLTIWDALQLVEVSHSLPFLFFVSDMQLDESDGLPPSH
jgi:hypothetical protein